MPESLRRGAILFVVILVVLRGGVLAAPHEFPTRPLKIVVYTNPGGLIDISARKIAQILEDRYVKESVVVENKRGAGGLVALQHVLRQPADGHTVFALTSSVISKAVASRQEQRLSQLEMVARLVDDYECIIVREGGEIRDFPSLVQSLRTAGKRVLWAGPAVGGTDHLFALKVWGAVGGKATWIPYKSGGEALAALLGGHAEVYVGNPQDIQGRRGLRILAVSSPERLVQYPEIPTVAELAETLDGADYSESLRVALKELSGESLWRGVALRRGTPPAVRTPLLELLEQVSRDAEWRKFVEEAGAEAVFQTGEEFQAAVTQQMANDKAVFQSIVR
ncbi:tripartite tricarboxylate transporter substrate binding protein [bacterium]|nr:tripartite tricarboxylate transporter substrate binding protein [bacterium]